MSKAITTDKTLLPCPFCGSSESSTVYGNESITALIVYERPVSYLNPEPTFVVHCRECGCYGGVGRTAEHAIKKWNTRKAV